MTWLGFGLSIQWSEMTTNRANLCYSLYWNHRTLRRFHYLQSSAWILTSSLSWPSLLDCEYRTSKSITSYELSRGFEEILRIPPITPRVQLSQLHYSSMGCHGAGCPSSFSTHIPHGGKFGMGFRYGTVKCSISNVSGLPLLPVPALIIDSVRYCRHTEESGCTICFQNGIGKR